MKIACIISILGLAVFSLVAGESASIEADITAVANAVDKNEKPYVIQFLRSPGTNSTTGSFVARNALNRQYTNPKIRMPLARCWKRLAVDRSISRDFRIYGFNQLLGLAGQDKLVIPIAKTAAEDISRGDSGSLKLKADAFLEKQATSGMTPKLIERPDNIRSSPTNHAILTQDSQLTRSQAIDIAVQLAAENKVQLKDYLGPQVMFQRTTRQWLISYIRKNSSGRIVGAFSVNIDDETKAATLLPDNL